MVDGPPRAGDLSPSAALLWDVDGTLLTTARAGLFAFEEALAETCGKACDLDGLRTSGLTDAEVAALVLETAGVERGPKRVQALLRAYEARLPAALHRRRGRVLPGVEEALADFESSGVAVSLLLTGNTERGARAKLRHYGLDAYFGRGAFCTGPGPRSEIARRAARAARELVGEDGRVFVIGDTPRDVACGAEIGALTVAVASGAFTVAELEAEGAWLVLERIPEPARFRALLGL